MPNIVIREIDKTVANEQQQSNNIAYIPGLSSKQTTYVFDTEQPTTSDEGTAGDTWVATALKKSWSFSAGETVSGKEYNCWKYENGAYATKSDSAASAQPQDGQPIYNVYGSQGDGFTLQKYNGTEWGDVPSSDIAVYGSSSNYDTEGYLNTQKISIVVCTNGDIFKYTSTSTLVFNNDTGKKYAPQPGEDIMDIVTKAATPQGHCVYQGKFTDKFKQHGDVVITAELIYFHTSADVAPGNKIYTADSVQYRWVEDQEFTYTPENTPTLFYSTEEFKKQFGGVPYQFTSDQQFPTEFQNDAKCGSYMFNAGDYDPSYTYAIELLNLGLPVLYENIVSRNDGEYEQPTVENIYTAFKGTPANSSQGTQATPSIFEKLKNRGEYSVKFITSGGYPTYEYDNNSVCKTMLEVQSSKVEFLDGDEDRQRGRGDCVALIDHTNNSQRQLVGSTSVWGQLSNVGGGYSFAETDHPEYGAMFTPWSYYSVGQVRGFEPQCLPASFGYLSALAKASKFSPDWMAVAGVKRGVPPTIMSLNTGNNLLTNTIAEETYQKRQQTSSINAITNIVPYGLTIWGNRTLKNNASTQGLTATSFLNIRNMLSDIKKTVYTACKSLMFEQNDDILWLNFRSKITPLLDQMKSGSGIRDYKIIRKENNAKGKLVAVITLYPLYQVESFDVTVELADTDTVVSE